MEGNYLPGKRRPLGGELHLKTVARSFTGKSTGCPALPACGRQVGGEENRPCNHIYISRKPRPVPACAKPLRRRQGRGASFPNRTKPSLLESQDGDGRNSLSDDQAGEIDDSCRLINDGGIAGCDDSWKTDENVFGNPDSLRIA